MDQVTIIVKLTVFNVFRPVKIVTVYSFAMDGYIENTTYYV